MMEEENYELSLKLQCGEETVSLINPYPSRGSPISLRAFETSTTAYDNGQDMRSTPLGGKLKFETSLGHLTAASCGFVKREILDIDAVSCRVGRDESDDIIRGAPRKKLRLSNYQSSILELKFREQSTLSRKHKSALANMLNMEPHQVDVWFQNRRARTKLKRKEEEYKIMKRCCDTLREENIRLEREMQALRTMQIVQGEGNLSAAVSFIIFPSCEHLATKNSATATFSKESVLV